MFHIAVYAYRCNHYRCNASPSPSLARGWGGGVSHQLQYVVFVPYCLAEISLNFKSAKMLLKRILALL